MVSESGLVCFTKYRKGRRTENGENERRKCKQVVEEEEHENTPSSVNNDECASVTSRAHEGGFGNDIVEELNKTTIVEGNTFFFIFGSLFLHYMDGRM